MVSLYEPFRRRQRAGEYAFSGSGLGLSICRKLVEAMGGELQVETEEGKGTRFSFVVQLPTATARLGLPAIPSLRQSMRNPMPKLLHVVGARPNFMKVAPVLQAGRARGGLEQVLLHTGQHYDAAMSDRFFQELGLPEPDVNLGVGSGTHAVQTGKILIEFDPVLERVRPDWVVVVRRRELHGRLRVGGGKARASGSPTSRPGSAASTGRCPRKSTGSSPTSSPTSA